MPGRDELVQENIDRANSSSGSGTTVSSTTTTDSSQSTVGTAPILSSHRTLMGANLDIVEALNLMVFSNATPLGDGGLRNSTAVIRRWSRQGTANVGTIPQSSITSIPFPTTTNPQTVPISYSTTTPPLSSTQTPYTVIFPGTTSVTTAQAFSPVPQGGSVGVTLAGSGTIPTTTEPPPLSEQSVVVQQSVNTPGSAAQAASMSGAPGAVKSANPSGIVYSGVFANQGGRGVQSKVGSLTPGQWQFLFNPSELELVVGPEFKTSETWGVSDKANSGQPLHWTHNKNAQLKFNSVLLNGYVFGRQVEELEQGLIDLFMARDGEGQYGPDILEFVWGRRIFGPCVIKDISIKEKMWDEGMVVNAELSFTLEQIPEWTINDGYVDVARPGRLPLIYDSTELQTPAESSGQSGSGAPGDQGKSGDQKPEQKSQQPKVQRDYVECKNLQNFISLASSFSPKPGSYTGRGKFYSSNFYVNLNEYTTGKPGERDGIIKKATSLGISAPPKCDATSLKKEYEDKTKYRPPVDADREMAAKMTKCGDEFAKKANTFFNNGLCNKFQGSPGEKLN